ncbi:MAG: hypothetical protein EB072_04805 [Betaproteobacteria bacterium]|nr:hypothetical protein [Betaproteobacteria bacterium]
MLFLLLMLFENYFLWLHSQYNLMMLYLKILCFPYKHLMCCLLMQNLSNELYFLLYLSFQLYLQYQQLIKNL